MGVDCRIILPGDVMVRDVANAIGIIAGIKPIKRELTAGGKDGSWDVDVPGVTVEGSKTMPQCCIIFLRSDKGLVDGEMAHHVMFHFEYYSDRLLMPRMTPFWVAVGKRLIEFFGGMLDKCDCDEVDADIVERQQYPNSPESDKPWQEFQERLFNIKPLRKFGDDYK